MKGGDFVATNEGTNAVYSEDLTAFISDGRYSTEPDPTYIVPKKCAVQDGEWWIIGEAVAEIGTIGYATLAKAIAAAKDGETIVLLKDVAEDRNTIGKSVTLDLNEKTLTGRLTVNDGTVKIKNGTIKGRLDAYDNANLTLDADATVEGQIVVWGDGTFGAAGSKTPTMTINGTVKNTGDSAVSTNGTDMSGAKIIVNDGASITSDDIAIYMPSGNLTVNGGTITGATAIYVKSGTTEIKGGTITGNGAAAAYNYNGDGAYATGDAIVVENCAYPNGEPVVSVTGGTLKSSNGKQVGAYYTVGTGKLALVTAKDNKLTVLENQMWVETETADVYKLVEAVVVTFVTENGASEAPKAQRIEKGTTATKPADPTKKNYNFLGWFADGATKAFDFSTAITEDITLTAKFEGVPVTIIYADYANGRILQQFSVHYDDPKSAYKFTALENIAAREGYHYSADVDEMWTIPVKEKADGNIVYVLKWLKGVTVQFSANGGTFGKDEHGEEITVIEVPVDLSGIEDVTVAAPETEPTRTGYTFKGWYLGENAYDFKTPVATSLILTAKWTPNKMKVTFDTDGGSAIEAVEVDLERLSRVR